MHVARLCAALPYWSPNFLLQPLLAAPLLREFAAYLVSGRPSGVEFRYPLLHTALLLCPPSLHCLILRSLVSKLSHTPSLVSKLFYSPSLVSKLTYSPTLVSKLSYSSTLVAKLSSSPTASRHAVTTRIRRVCGKRPAICCRCCSDLWGVIQLLTFPLYFGKHLKACSYSPAFPCIS